MNPRANWTRERYAFEIEWIRTKAKALRAQAERMDAKADTLARETVKFDVMELPMINPEGNTPCQTK